jgi:hypothetical protein
MALKNLIHKNIMTIKNVCACVCALVCACVFVCIHLFICTINVYACIKVYARIKVHACIKVYACINICMYKSICIHSFIFYIGYRITFSNVLLFLLLVLPSPGFEPLNLGLLVNCCTTVPKKSFFNFLYFFT